MGNESERNVAVFWDYENCEIPSSSDGYSAAAGIRNLVEKFGPVKLFKAYLESGKQSNLTPRLELTSSGVDIIDCPHNGKKDVVDMTLIVDMLTHALDNLYSNTTIVLISGDGDYMRALASLRNRKYHTIVITPRDCSHSALKYQAYGAYDWYSDVIAPMQRQMHSRSPAAPKYTSVVQGRVPQAQLPTPPETGIEPTSVLPGPKKSSPTQTQNSTNELLGSAKETEKKVSEGETPNDAEEDSSTLQSKSPTKDNAPILTEEPHGLTPRLSWAQLATKGSFLPSTSGKNLSLHDPPERLKFGAFAGASYFESLAEGEQDTATTQVVGENDAPNEQKLYSEVAALQQSSTNVFSSSITGSDQAPSNPDVVIPTVAMYHNKKPPREFKALVKVLEAQRLQGSTRVVSSVLGSGLLKEDESVYRRAGVTKLKDYLAQAQKAGVAILGKEDFRENGNRWIALHPEYHGYGRKPVVVLPPPVIPNGWD